MKYAKSHVFGAFEADFLWKIENSPPSNVWISDFGRKIRLNFGEDLFFFFGDHLILGGKNLWSSDFGKKSDSFSAKTFFFLETTQFWAEKTFEFPSFPRNFVWIFGQSKWNWFKKNENPGQGRLHFSHSFKIAPPPPFSKSWLRSWFVGSYRNDSFWIFFHFLTKWNANIALMHFNFILDKEEHFCSLPPLGFFIINPFGNNDFYFPSTWLLIKIHYKCLLQKFQVAKVTENCPILGVFQNPFWKQHFFTNNSLKWRHETFLWRN